MRNCKYNLSMVTCSECVKVHALLAYVHTYVRIAPFCVLGISCLFVHWGEYIVVEGMFGSV